MDYILLHEKLPVDFNTLFFKGKDLKTNFLYQYGSSEYYLHEFESNERSFFNDLKQNKEYSFEYFNFNNEQLVSIFKYFYSNGLLKSLRFHNSWIEDEDEYHQLQDLLHDKDRTKIDTATSLFRFIIEELGAKLWHFNLFKEIHRQWMTANLYTSSALIVNTSPPIKMEVNNFAISIYTQLLEVLINKSELFNQIDLQEYPIKEHPLHLSHAILSSLFKDNDKAIKEQFNLNDNQFEKIKDELLTHTKQFEGKKVYYKEK